MRIRGLTLHQPWAYAVASGHKRVENRSWAPPRAWIGEWIAIHAGREMDFGAIEFLRDRGVALPPRLPRGTVVAAARIVDVVTHCDDPWFFGPYGWILDSLVTAETEPCRGALRLWTLPPHIEHRVRVSIEAAGIAT